MSVHFIGAGPGAADLITVRGRDLLARCGLCLFAGSLVAPEMLSWCAPGTPRIDTAPLDLDTIIAHMARAHAAGIEVARLHSGDLSVWSAAGEQMRRLDALAIPYTLTPGVPAFAAAAAALGAELTVPERAQSLVLTRTSGRATPMPARETLAGFAATGATLAIHLSIHVIDQVAADLLPFYGADCPAAVVFRASWPEECIIRAPLGALAERVAEARLERSATIFVGPALSGGPAPDSALYAPGYDRRFRPRHGPTATPADHAATPAATIATGEAP
ncbi:precorrin-4 C(11)-methyltransferase [Xanthobacter sp. V4C-4]|uniref:precorrin-4 C(11)-methyltransferase n=1 Tax=Xanthobacter cornucopiae TaxID=3119924 RepID=UPI00372AFBDF